MKKNHVLNSIDKASKETTRLLSAHLRTEARKSGWPQSVVRNLSVNHDNDGFSVHVHEDHHSTAQNLEYGTPDTQPTAAIRRFSNRTRNAEGYFVHQLMKDLESHL